ncbi:hypothetical protein KM043_017746 [Ampulex compressa]|nr:hypothetical protein KM043_017746 [Ampulex compressa]
MEYVRLCLLLPPQKVTSFVTEEDMLNAYVLHEAEKPFSNVLAVEFQQYNGYDIKYKIRHSWKIPNLLYRNIQGEYMGTMTGIYFDLMPFIQLQMCVDESFINHTATVPIRDTKLSIQQMPYPPYVKIDVADMALRSVICMFAVVAFLIPLCIEANFAAKEKFIGVNVLMAMNGVKPYQNLLSWLIIGIIFSIFYVVPILILFKNTFSGNVDPYLYYSNAFIFWLLLTTHVAHLISYGMHIAAYFSKPRFVVTTLSIIYTASFSLHGNLIQGGYFAIIPYLGIIFPNILLFRLLEEVNAYENKLTGIQWSNMFFAGDSQYCTAGSAGFIFIFSILGAVLHFILAVYANAIFPGKYGVRKSLLYFLPHKKKNQICLNDEIGDFEYDKVGNEDFEPVKRGILIPGIQIRDLRKTYKTSWFRKSAVHALRGISVDFYKGQITALLGHNGAGKTTLMSILTGLTSETEGKVFINGKNVKKDLEIIQNDLGLCPQENMVFPDLNVFEQIQFFGLLKNRHKTRKQINHEVDILLNKLKLYEKRNVLPDKLSGGQKRRLCLGMALIGDASTIILDEPTSGMDPETRRDTWDIVLKMRGEKTILISTHNMEEADVLGDRIAIVHAGRLRSYGTSMFLKKQYGHGHVEVTLSTKSWCNPEKVKSKFDSRTQQISVDSEKIILSIPYSDSLPQSLDKVESQKKKLGITGISVSLITLEEVFLKIVKKEDNKHLSELFVPTFEKLKGCKLYLQAIMALFHKKMTYTRKNLSNVLAIIIFPLLSVLLMGLSYDIPEDSTDVFPLKLDIYRSPEALYSFSNETIGLIYQKTVQYYGGIATHVPQNLNFMDALLNLSMQDIARYRNNLIISAEYNMTEDFVSVNGFYSNTAMHSIPLTVNLLSNALIKATAGEQYTIDVSRQQLPNTLSSTKLQKADAESLSRVSNG